MHLMHHITSALQTDLSAGTITIEPWKKRRRIAQSVLYNALVAAVAADAQLHKILAAMRRKGRTEELLSIRREFLDLYSQIRPGYSRTGIYGESA